MMQPEEWKHIQKYFKISGWYSNVQIKSFKNAPVVWHMLSFLICTHNTIDKTKFLPSERQLLYIKWRNQIPNCPHKSCQNHFCDCKVPIGQRTHALRWPPSAPPRKPEVHSPNHQSSRRYQNRPKTQFRLKSNTNGLSPRSQPPIPIDIRTTRQQRNATSQPPRQEAPPDRAAGGSGLTFSFMVWHLDCT